MSKASTYRPEDIRNIVLLGHGGSGKTTLAEAILSRCGNTSRMGSVEDGSTVSDFEPEARAHQHSTNSTLLFATKENREINIIDTPGHPEFVGYALAAMPATEIAVVVVNAMTGVEYNTRRLFNAATEAGLARMIVVNKIDGNPNGLKALVDELKSTFGPKVHCLNLPAKGATDVVDCFDEEAGSTDFGSVKEVHAEILESTVEVDDNALERYLGGEKLDLKSLRKTFVRAMAIGHMVPIVFTGAKSGIGVDDLVHILIEEAPSPVSGRARKLKKGEEDVEIRCDPEKPFLGHVFKVTTDPHLGQLVMLRVLQGKLENNGNFMVVGDRRGRKAGHLLKVQGKDHPEVEASAWAGEIVALARVEDLHVDQILKDGAIGDDFHIDKFKYPTPMLSLAVEPKNRGDEVKLSQSLARIAEEDPTFKYVNDPVTHELVLSGMGDIHLKVILERLKNRFRLETVSKAPTIPYRETITAKAESHYRHKKQTGGAGQFAEVYVRVEPLKRGEGIEFKSEVFGGAIPTNFIPAVEKGFRDACEAGVLAGFPVHDVRYVVYDGKHHPVDSKDIAFRTAGKMAMREAMAAGKPVLLEPLVTMEITAPEQHMGAITGDLKHYRARVMGMDSLPGGISVVKALAPLAELGNYGGQLRGMTGGQGSFAMELSHYEPVPPAVQQKIIESRPKRQAESD